MFEQFAGQLICGVRGDRDFKTVLTGITRSGYEARTIRNPNCRGLQESQRLFGQVRPDMTEREVAQLMRRLILEEGGDNCSFVILQLDLPGAGNQFNYDRPLQQGTVLAIDAGARVGMYTVDYARMATLGPATQKQRLCIARLSRLTARCHPPCDWA